MKKKLLTALLGLSLLFCASCVQRVTPLPGDYPMDFLFSSGAGAWGTRLTLNADGSFSGLYHDSDMGDSGEGYPNGTAYTCSFTGEFLPPEKVDEHTYRLHLGPVTLERPAGEEWLEEGIRYFSAGPHGLQGADFESPALAQEFILYSPDTPVSGLDEEFLSWWPGRFGENPPDTLGCYALWNTETGMGFFENPDLVY